MSRRSSHITADPAGGYEVRLPDEERELLAALPGRILTSLQAMTPNDAAPASISRLFPPAYPTDESAEATFEDFARGDLLEHHVTALTWLRDNAEATHLDDEGIDAWLTALTDLRLVLGTSLGVTEQEPSIEPGHPDYYEWICYLYLSGLQQEIVEVLATALPAAARDEPLPDDPWGEPLGGLRWDGTPTPDEP